MEPVTAFKCLQMLPVSDTQQLVREESGFRCSWQMEWDGNGAWAAHQQAEQEGRHFGFCRVEKSVLGTLTVVGLLLDGAALEWLFLMSSVHHHNHSKWGF